jgi:hypothetical protein
MRKWVLHTSLLLLAPSDNLPEVLEARSRFIAEIVQSVSQRQADSTFPSSQYNTNPESNFPRPSSLLEQPSPASYLPTPDPDAALMKLMAEKAKLEGEIERQRKLVQRDPERMAKLQKKIPIMKTNLRRELQVRKVKIDAMRATQKQAKTKAVEFFRDHEDAERLLGEMETSFERRREEGNAQVQMLYSAYLQAGGLRDLEVEDELVGGSDEIDIGKPADSTIEDGISTPLEQNDDEL